jgi:hypothetical protein
MKTKVKESVEQWLEKIIIGLNLCPFAKKPYLANSIRIQNTQTNDENEMIQFFLDELDYIQNNKSLSTSLVVFQNASLDFLNFYDLFSLMEDLIEQLKLQHEFQVVCFHPQFIFENTEPDKRINVVNRSPYPLIHILRSIEIENALNSPEEGEKISFSNEKLLDSMSDAEFQTHFKTKL